MKRTLVMSMVMAAATLVNGASTGFAQSAPGMAETPDTSIEEGYENTLTIAPIELIAVQDLQIEYERVLTDHWSWFGMLGERGGFDPEVLRFRTGVRFFFAGEAPECWFLSPNAQILYVDVDDGSEAVEGTAFAAGGLVGYTALLWDSWVLSGGLGLNYVYADGEVEGELAAGPEAWEGVLPDLRLSVGGAF